MAGLDSGALVLVCACCVVRHIVDDGRDRRVGCIRIRLRSEESIDVDGTCAEEEIHGGGGWGAVCLGATTHVK